MNENLKDYFNGDEMAMNVWKTKYAQPEETSPDDMHLRMAKEFARADFNYAANKESVSDLSEYGKELFDIYSNLSEEGLTDRYFKFFEKFRQLIPQGSIMATLGTSAIASLSNCFVVGSPENSYGGIMRIDEEQVQLMKRRGGVGIDLSSLQPAETPVNNSAKTSTGAVSFAHRYSNTTREVAQNGRRGALMLSMHINHPDILDFIFLKRDLSSVTGANISVKISDEFMDAVENEEEFILRYPVDLDMKKLSLHDEQLIYDNNLNTLVELGEGRFAKRVSASYIWKELVASAHGVAEPGILFWDTIVGYSPDGVYPQFKQVTTNPCFHPDTQIDTEFGRLKIKDINKPMRVYSMDSDGRLVMANASASFISKYNAETLKINLKNGNSIQVTPEHKMYVHDKGWVEAKDIEIGDRIGHLCRSRRGAKYAGVHLTTSPNKQIDQVMEHKLVFGLHEADYDVHHLNRDTYNNSINNLELLTHSEHSRITALEDNPQTHQIKDERGQFISGENSRKGAKVIVDLPNELKTNMLSRFHNCVESIVEGETTDVYDIQVEGTHCLIANNMVAHNCGEIPMQAYDACRLFVSNLYYYVDNPFTNEAKFNKDKYYKSIYEATRMMDNIIDLEVEYIDRILNKVYSDPETDYTKSREIGLWLKIKETALKSRRTGLGYTALGDMLAAVGLKYDSEEGMKLFHQVMRTKMKAELACTIDLAIQRGAFAEWDVSKEFKIDTFTKEAVEGKNDFYEMLLKIFPEEVARMVKFGRRNLSWSTVAPTGSVSILTQTTSGIEPLFSPFHMRRKKINPSDKGVRVDFIDDMGDHWQEFPIMHPKFKDWVRIAMGIPIENLEKFNEKELSNLFTQSPWFKSTANDIDWTKRVKLQSIAQIFTTHSISSTINLPKDVTTQEVSTIYMEAWKQGLKGITVYRDGSRSGVLVNPKSEPKIKFTHSTAPKRPKDMPCEIHTTTTKGRKYNAVVSMMEGKPYEVFITKHFTNESNLTLRKMSRGRYDLYKATKLLYEDISAEMTDEQEAITRLVSTALRHGAEIKFIVEQLQKTPSDDMFTFTKSLARVLKKYIPNGAKSTLTCENPECKSTNVVFQEGCNICLDCGHSACS